MPSTQWKEVVAVDEQERFARYAEQIAKVQARRKQPARGFHPKLLCAAKATFEVLASADAQGLFAQPKTYDAWVRFSNGAVRVQDDRKGDVRGLVVKVLGVEGKKVIPALANATTQDFSLIHTRSLAFRNADEFMWLVGAMNTPLTLLPKMLGRFGVGRTFSILSLLRKTTLRKIPTLAGEQFWSPMAVQYGPYAVRYSLRPAVPAQPLASGTPDYLSEDLAARLLKAPLEYEFLIQFFEDESRTPIEDTSVEWEVPYVKVARLVLAQQDVNSEEGKKFAEQIEAHSFNPWHALEAHRPLGDMMRARNPAYVTSTKNRSAANEP